MTEHIIVDCGKRRGERCGHKNMAHGSRELPNIRVRLKLLSRKIPAHTTVCECFNVGNYLSTTRLWKLTDDSNFTIRVVADEFENGYTPIIQSKDGFLEYGGSIVTGTDKIFFFNVFETAEGAQAANAGAASFVADAVP